MNATKAHVRPMMMTTTSSSQQQKKQRLDRDCIKNQRVLEKRRSFALRGKADDDWKDEDEDEAVLRRRNRR